MQAFVPTPVSANVSATQHTNCRIESTQLIITRDCESVCAQSSSWLFAPGTLTRSGKNMSKDQDRDNGEVRVDVPMLCLFDLC